MAPNNSRTRLLLWSALGVAVNAIETLDGFISSGASVPDNYYDNSTTDSIITAQKNPNATREVAFKPFAVASDTNSGLNLANVEWTWRVNISDFATPDIRDAFDVVDPHLVSTSYDFSWSATEAVPAGLDNPSSGLCITTSDATDMPANVTNAFTYDGADGSADCALALGQSCVDAILAGAGTPVASENGTLCNAPRRAWSALDECRSTLGYNQAANGHSSTGTFGLSYYTNTSSPNGTAGRGKASGEGVYGHFSGAQNGSGAAEYYSAANRLQIMLVNPMLRLDDGAGGEGGTYGAGPGLYCMRVNATKLPTGDTDGDGVAFTSEAVLESAGTSVQARAVGALSVLFSVLCAMLLMG